MFNRIAYAVRYFFTDPSERGLLRPKGYSYAANMYRD
jgi:hypothetical protein